MPIDEKELRTRYGQLACQEGKSLFESGHVDKPRSVGTGVFSVNIRHGYMTTEVLVWDSGDGTKVARTVGGRSFTSASEVAALLACCSSGGIDADFVLSRFTNDPIFREHLEYGGLEDELEELAEKLIGEFIESLCETHSPFGILDTLDVAIDSCYRNRECDTVALGRLMESRAREMEDRIQAMTPNEVSRILGSSERIFSRRWLAESRLSHPQVMVAFADLSDRKSLNSYDTAILSLLSRKVDPEEYADVVTDDLGYYEMERIAMRELRRGHRDIATSVSRRFSRARDFDEHLSEAGRLRQEFGLDDDEGVFIRAFVDCPNEKRLLDLIANHPDLDTGSVLETAWAGSERTPTGLVFFARNGFESQVAEFLSRNGDWISDHMREDADTLQLLGEVLKDRRQHVASANLLILVLEDCLKEKGSENVAAHIMNTLDSEYDESESVLRHYCANFRTRHRNRTLWNTYGSGGHF